MEDKTLRSNRSMAQVKAAFCFAAVLFLSACGSGSGHQSLSGSEEGRITYDPQLISQLRFLEPVEQKRFTPVDATPSGPFLTALPAEDRQPAAEDVQTDMTENISTEAVGVCSRLSNKDFPKQEMKDVSRGFCETVCGTAPGTSYCSWTIADQEPIEIVGSQPYFNEDDYLARYPLVADAVKKGEIASGALHYALFGIHEGHMFLGSAALHELVFDEESYLLENPDVAAATEQGVTDPITHFMTEGICQSRKINASGQPLPVPSTCN